VGETAPRGLRRPRRRMRRVVDHPLRAGRPGVSCTARLSNASDRERPCPAVQELLRESNDLVEPEEGEDS